MCDNPWKKCDDPNIHLYIVEKGKKLGICVSCWLWICKMGKEIG